MKTRAAAATNERGTAWLTGGLVAAGTVDAATGGFPAGAGPMEKASLQGTLERPTRLKPKAVNITAAVLNMNTSQPSKSCRVPSAMAAPQCSTVIPMKPMRRLFMITVMGMADRKTTVRFHIG